MIKDRVLEIKAERKKLYYELLDLQLVCEHPNVTKKYRGNSGNYDPSADSYWIEWRCPDCEKAWTSDQSRANVLKPGVVID